MIHWCGQYKIQNNGVSGYTSDNVHVISITAEVPVHHHMQVLHRKTQPLLRPCRIRSQKWEQLGLHQSQAAAELMTEEEDPAEGGEDPAERGEDPVN